MKSKGSRPRGKRARGAVTVRDVASRAGVSPMTVSRVVNGDPHVSEKTRKAVLASVRALNYLPNQAARALVRAEGRKIGLLFANPSAAYLGEFLLGALDASGHKSAQLMLQRCATDNDKAVRATLRKLMKDGAAGVLLPPPLCENAAVHTLLAERDIPAVAVSPGLPLVYCSSVRIDDFRAAHEMTAHLIAMGHRRIAFIKGHPSLSASAQRLQGFEAAMQEAGCELRPELIAQGYFDYRSGLQAADKLLKLAEPPTAIFASNDDMAAGAVSAAHRRGLDVPGDISVAGFDDTPILAAVWPSVTTIRQPVARMAGYAIDQLFREIRARQAGMRGATVDRVVAHSLVERETVAAPRR